MNSHHSIININQISYYNVYMIKILVLLLRVSISSAHQVHWFEYDTHDDWKAAATSLLDEHIENLKSDDIPNNATRSSWELIQLLRHSIIDKEIIEELLNSSDSQQRKYAKKILNRATPSKKIIQEYKDELRNDYEPWNASISSGVLTHLLQKNHITISSMETLLYSEDYQQRQYAAWIIRSAKPNYKSDILYKVIVESLSNDQFPWDKSRSYANPNETWGSMGACFGENYFYNAMLALTDLMDNGHYAKSHLIDGLYSNDAQLSFFSAVILGENQIKDEIKKTVEILCKNLRDDTVESNACMAMSALYNMGPDVNKYMLNEYNSDDSDQQAKECIILLWSHLGYVPKSWTDINHETFGKISHLSNDPEYFKQYNKKYFILGQKQMWYSHFGF
jgi:hypothetical protein